MLRAVTVAANALKTAIVLQACSCSLWSSKLRPASAGIWLDTQIPDRHQRLQRDPAGRQRLATTGESVDHHHEPFHDEAKLNGPIDGQER